MAEDKQPGLEPKEAPTSLERLDGVTLAQDGSAARFEFSSGRGEAFTFSIDKAALSVLTEQLMQLNNIAARASAINDADDGEGVEKAQEASSTLPRARFRIRLDKAASSIVMDVQSEDGARHGFTLDWQSLQQLQSGSSQALGYIQNVAMPKEPQDVGSDG